MRSLRWWLTSAVVVATGVAGLGVPAAQAATKLDIPAFWQVLADPIRDRLFVSTGKAGDSVKVLNADGAEITSITGLKDPRGMALNRDGSKLYVALRDGNAVAGFDAVTLKEEFRYDFGPGGCPTWLAPAGGKLYVGYNCQSSKGKLGSLDLSGDEPVFTGDLQGDHFSNEPPLLRSHPGKPGLLISANRSAVSMPFDSMVRVYDVSSGTPKRTADLPNSTCTGLHDAVLTADASKVILSCSYLSSERATSHRAFSTADLSPAGTYPSASGPVVSTSSPDGSLVIVGDSNGQDVSTIHVEKADGTLVRRYDLPAGTFVERQGLAVLNDTLYAVTENRTTGEFAVSVLTGYAAPHLRPAITASAPASATRGAPVTVTGQLSFTNASTSQPAPVGTPRTLIVTRKDAAGTRTLPAVTTSGSGSFSFADTPTVGGPVTWTVSLPAAPNQDAASRAVTVDVSRTATPLTVTTNYTNYAYGANATVTATLGKTYTSRSVCILAQRQGAARATLKCGNVDAAGRLSVTYPMLTRTVFTAQFAGDLGYAPVTVTRTANAYAKVTSTLSKNYSTSGAYKVYRQAVKPVLTTTVAPANAGTCVYLTVQRYVGKTWTNVVSTGCHKLGVPGKVTYQYAGARPVGVSHRVMARFAGNTANLSTNGAWQYFSFRK